MPKPSLSVLAVALLSLACASGVEDRIAAARTTADVTSAVGTPPTCAAETCMWHKAIPKRSCVGYSGCLSHRDEGKERVVTCRVDRDERVSVCRVEVVR
jgi:hypothetical protein